MSPDRQSPVLDVVGDDSSGDEAATDYVDHIDEAHRGDGRLQVRKSNGELLLLDDLTGGDQHEQLRPTTSDPEATKVGTSSKAKVGTSSKAKVGTSSKAKDPSKMRTKTHTFLTCVSQLAMELDKSMKVVTKNDMVELKSMLKQFTDGYEHKTVGTLWRILNEDIKQGYRHQYNLALTGEYHDRIGPVGTFAAEMADIQTRREQRLITLEISKHKADSARIAVVAQMADLALKRKHLKDEGVELPAKLAKMLDKWSAMPDSGDEDADENEENAEDVDYNEDDGSSGDDYNEDVDYNEDDGSSGDDVSVIEENITAGGSSARSSAHMTSKTYPSYVNDYVRSTLKGSAKKKKGRGPRRFSRKKGRGDDGDKDGHDGDKNGHGGADQQDVDIESAKKVCGDVGNKKGRGDDGNKKTRGGAGRQDTGQIDIGKKDRGAKGTSKEQQFGDDEAESGDEQLESNAVKVEPLAVSGDENLKEEVMEPSEHDVN